jgi:peptidoglycan/xylan/chitin deacetylase (PgdA/CDA1 family)
MLVPTAGTAAAQVAGMAEGPPDPDVAVSGASAPASTESCPAGFLAMTFDDGPQEHTPAVLDTLVDTGTLATFFVLGRVVEQQPSMTQRTDAEGHGVANHSHEHERLSELADDQIVETIERADAAIRDAGVVPLELMRPPYGDTDHRVEQAIESTGYLQMLWDVDSRDWESTASEIQANVSAGIEPGAVILLHDGSSNTPETIAALPGIVDEARDRGYCFTTMDATGSLVPLRFVDAGGAGPHGGDRTYRRGRDHPRLRRGRRRGPLLPGRLGQPGADGLVPGPSAGPPRGRRPGVRGRPARERPRRGDRSDRGRRDRGRMRCGRPSVLPP